MCFTKLPGYHANRNEDRPIQSAAEMWSRDSSFGNIRFMRLFVGFPGQGCQTTVRGRKRRFSVFLVTISSETSEIRTGLLSSNM